MKSPDQNDEAIEKALHELHPRKLSAELRERLERSVPPMPSVERTEQMVGPTWFQLLIRFAIPALALALLANWWPNHTIHLPVRPLAKAPIQPVEQNFAFTPIETNQYVLASEELALLPGPDDRPVQLLRVRLLDYEVSRADDGSELYLTSEHEQIIPITLTVY